MSKPIIAGADQYGNKILVDYATNSIYLKLAKDNRRRLIGVMEPAGGSLFVKRSRFKHVLRKAQAYGFNDYVLRNAKKFNKIILEDEGGRYELPIALIIEKGQYLFFKEQGFEKQIFLSLRIIETNKIGGI